MTHPMSPGQQGAELECDPKHLDSGRCSPPVSTWLGLRKEDP